MSTLNIIDFLEAGIKAEALRQKAIANNIANLQTPGYRRIDVKFEQLLADALNSSTPIKADTLKAQFYRPKNTPIKSNGNDVDLESEVGEIIKNAIKHQLYVRLLIKKYNQMELAINVG